MPMRALSPTGPFYRESTTTQRSRPPIRAVGLVSSDRFERSKQRPCLAGLPNEIKLQIIGELGVISPHLLDALAAVSPDFRNLAIVHAIHTLEREATEWERQKLKSMTGEEVMLLWRRIHRSLLVVGWLTDPKSARLRSAKEQSAKRHIIWRRKSKFQTFWSAIASFVYRIIYFLSGLFSKTKVEADTHYSPSNLSAHQLSRMKCILPKLNLMLDSIEQRLLKK